MSKKWKIKTANDVTGGNDKADPIGCSIRETDDGKHYEFIAVLAKTTGASLPPDPPPSFAFPSFSFDGHTWTITVTSISDNQVQGNWRNDDPNITEDESGTWTAQADQGADEEDASAASA